MCMKRLHNNGFNYVYRSKWHNVLVNLDNHCIYYCMSMNKNAFQTLL